MSLILLFIVGIWLSMALVTYGILAIQFRVRSTTSNNGNFSELFKICIFEWWKIFFVLVKWLISPSSFQLKWMDQQLDYLIDLDDFDILKLESQSVWCAIADILCEYGKIDFFDVIFDNYNLIKIKRVKQSRDGKQLRLV